MRAAAKISGAGIGLRPVHVPAFLGMRPENIWCEVISDNYLSTTDRDLLLLDRVRSDYSLSLHGVGMSLGSADPLDETYLSRLKTLVERFQPSLVSEHLCWTSIGGHHLHDLLPLPYTAEVARYVADRIDAVQDFLGREILVENVSSYLTYRESTLPEWDFVGEVVRQAGCGVLLDVSNIVVSTTNHNLSVADYLQHIINLPIREIHLGGFQERDGYLLDTHDRPIDPRAWNLFRAVVEITGAVPCLIEWDNDLPALEEIIFETQGAQKILNQYATYAA